MGWVDGVISMAKETSWVTHFDDMITCFVAASGVLDKISDSGMQLTTTLSSNWTMHSAETMQFMFLRVE